MGHILRGGTHLLRLIDDVLDLSRIEARNVSVSIEPVELRAVLREVMTSVEPGAVREGIALEKIPAPCNLPFVLADQTRLTQILMNFASNAVKYNRRGGHVAFEITMSSPERVRVTVRDTGMGIPVDKQKLVFQPFQRAGQETGPIEGTGIGLAISKRLAELMSASVGFASVPGEGSVFWIELPVHVAAAEIAATASSARAVNASRVRGAGRRLVLYVEDNRANVAFMQEFFTTCEGLDLLVSPNAEDAIVLAKARRPDVILMDINLPGMSGLDALRVLRGLPETRGIPVIALTAAASARDRERGERAGFHRYLAKPIQLDELEAALTSAVGEAD